MTHAKPRFALAAMLAIGSFAGPAPAESAKDVFNSLFGDEWKKVAATRETADDLALAQTLVGAAKTAKGQNELVELLCNNAYTLATRDTGKDGCEAAVDAMKQLAGLVPDKAAEAHEKIITVMRTRFARADAAEKAEIGQVLIESYITAGAALELTGDYAGALKQYQQAKVLARQVSSPQSASIDALLDAATQRERVERRLAQLEEKVASDPSNKMQRLELITLYVQLDKPAAAVAHAAQSGDAEMARLVPLAVKKVEDVPVNDCLSLAEWYRGLAAKAENDAAKRTVLGRSVQYFQRVIDGGKKQDLAVVKATLTINRVKEELAKLDQAADTATAPGTTTKKTDKGEEIDLVKLVDPAKDSAEGKWEKGAGKIGITIDGTTSAGWLDLPVEPRGDYEMNVTFNRATGRAVTKIFVPIVPKTGLKDRTGRESIYVPGVAVTLGLDDGKVGAIEAGPGSTYYSYYWEESSWKGKDFSRAVRFSNGKPYAVKIKVEHEKGEAKVTVYMGGEKYLAWRGEPFNSNAQSYRKTASPGLAAYNTVNRSSAVFSNVNIQAIDGEVKKLRDEK